MPEHTEITGKKRIGRVAEQTLHRPKINLKLIIPTRCDFAHLISPPIHHACVIKWQDLHTNKLGSLKKAPTPWHSLHLPSRKTEIILTRLRVGHTRLTLTHLFTHLVPSICPHCGIAIPLSVQHSFKRVELTNLRNTFSIPPSH